MNPSCLLCGLGLECLPEGEQFVLAKIAFIHPEVDDCEVRVTDRWGISLDDELAVHLAAQVEVAEDEIKPTDPNGFVFNFSNYPPVEEALTTVFNQVGLERLGGVSTGRGWSSFANMQKCPRAWKRRYLDGVRGTQLILSESPALAIGSLMHAFLAVHYTAMMIEEYPLTPDSLHAGLRLIANPEFVAEGWRIFSNYRLYYKHEVIQPLAVEYDLKDPRTGESCRFDMIAYFPESVFGRLPGVYIVESKTGSRFDQNFLEGWVCDGEVIGQVALWSKLKLDKRFGKLQGVIMNLCGKQKEPQFHRTLVAPTSYQIKSHLDDLVKWEALMNLATATNSFPRARNNCIGKYGRCDYWDECSGDLDRLEGNQ